MRQTIHFRFTVVPDSVSRRKMEMGFIREVGEYTFLSLRSGKITYRLYTDGHKSTLNALKRMVVEHLKEVGVGEYALRVDSGKFVRQEVA
jgi:hypothetical protein